MEQIQRHEIKDVYRIKDGLLVEVNKYKRHSICKEQANCRIGYMDCWR